MLSELIAELELHASPEKAMFFPRFFKTGIGEYGEGDQFLGITVPDCRTVARKFKTLSLGELKELLSSPWHEQRLVALLILVAQYQEADESTQTRVYSFYLSSTSHINNWDLVDLSCRDIVGAYIYSHPSEQKVLDKLTQSPLLWDRRIAIISTFYFIMREDPEPTLRIVKTLLHDKHDLIQKASGWMLRELGKRIDKRILIDFLKANYSNIPRTTLRYAIEHFPSTTRKQYLLGRFD